MILSSMFRNSLAYIPRYFLQIDALREHADFDLVLAEGDSTDGTPEALMPHGKSGDKVFHIDHGGERFGSIDHPQRWDQIAYVMRRLMDKVLDRAPDLVIWVESDLVWDAVDMLRLIDDAKNGRAVTPMVFADGTNRFYDVFGYRIRNIGFNAQPPYYPTDPEREGEFVKVDTCGSCFVTPEPERHLRNWSGHWPFGAAGELWLDPQAVVRHP